MSRNSPSLRDKSELLDAPTPRKGLSSQLCYNMAEQSASVHSENA
jgi:hypothetical protein